VGLNSFSKIKMIRLIFRFLLINLLIGACIIVFFIVTIIATPYIFNDTNLQFPK